LWLQVGGTIGAFGLAWLIARGGFIPMLTATFAVATVSIALIGQPGISLILLGIIVFVAGWAVIGGQPGVNALSATFYPTYLRSTGLGWGLGIGRIGAIVGPYIGGMLIGLQWGPQELFYATAVPAFISTLTMVALMFRMKLPAHAATAQPAPVAH
jgi:AAHS family 4-hydroxybenzoate transporter-like MFS transporter